MKNPRSLIAAALTSLLLISCGGEDGNGSGPDRGAASEPPPPPSPEVVAALQAQPFGKNLLGKTVLLVGNKFVPADLQSAPEYYLVHYSASW